MRSNPVLNSGKIHIVSRLVHPTALRSVTRVRTVIRTTCSPCVRHVNHGPTPVLSSCTDRILTEHIRILTSRGRLDNFIILVSARGCLLLSGITIDPTLGNRNLNQRLLSFTRHRTLRTKCSSVHLCAGRTVDRGLTLCTHHNFIRARHIRRGNLHHIRVDGSL